MSNERENGATLYVDTQDNDKKDRPLDWGPHPPRRLRKARDIHAYMSEPENWYVSDYNHDWDSGRWFIVEELVYWYNSHHRYDITSNWLGNVLSKNPLRFEKGPDVYRKSGMTGNSKKVALWRAI